LNIGCKSHLRLTRKWYNTAVGTRRAFIVDTVGAVAALAAVASCSRQNSSAGAETTVEAQAAPSDPETTTSAAPIPSTSSTSSTSPDPTDDPWAMADFAELDAFLDAADTEAFRIVEQGEVVHEWYRNDSSYGRDTASAQKSVLSLLVGRAIADGLFDLDTPIDDVLGVGWTPHGQSAGITVRQLLSMTSGLDDQFAVIAPPGTMWRYSGAFAALFDVLTTTTGRQLNEIADDWLFDPSGASTAQFYERRSSEFAPIGLFARASDLTAIGQMVLDRAQPGVPDVWLDESLATSQPYNEAYGYLWWLNGKESFLLPGRAMVARPGPLVPSAPAGMVAALGKDDQKLYLVADLGLAVARLGGKAAARTELARSSFDDDLWQLLSQMRPT
jgi:CubicO group peptidase (beta-lactamase class C family)